jgi:hypothetical protein
MIHVDSVVQWEIIVVPQPRIRRLDPPLAAVCLPDQPMPGKRSCKTMINDAYDLF